MKYKKLRIILAILVCLIVVGGITAAITCTYYFNGIDVKWLWIPLILSCFFFDVICGLILFNTSEYSDEVKAFWLFIILVFPVLGSIFWLFIGRQKQKGYGKGKNNQATLLSHILKAKQSVKIYTNSLFISYDTIKALNLASWKNAKVDIVICDPKKKWKQNLLRYDINRFFEPRINVYFTNKEIEHNFILIDDKEVLFSKSNFNYRNLYKDAKIYLAENIFGYVALWNREFIKSSIFKHDQSKTKWWIRLKYGICNIFYIFY